MLNIIFPIKLYIFISADESLLPLRQQADERCMPFMKILLTILLSAWLTAVFGQNAADSKYRFAMGVFKSDLYRPATLQKFGGEIKKTGDTYYKFGDKKLKISVPDTTLLIIFQKGIFNPDIVFGEETTHKEQAELDTLPQNQKVFYNLTRNDSLSICCFEPLGLLDPNPQTRRFKFWVFRIGMANPTEYYLELQNYKATKATTLKEFLESSTMTFYYKGTIII